MTSQVDQDWDEEAHDAASGWWSRMRGPEADRCRPAFEQWLAADPGHRAAYAALQDSWILSEGLGDTEIGQRRSLERARSSFRVNGPKVAALAAAAAAIAMVVVLPPGADTQTPAPARIAMLMQTAIGEIRTLDLPDGSQVTLDTDSQVRVRFAAQTRRVELVRGRARFDVNADPARSFVVEAGETQAVALEGRFDAALLPQSVCLWAWDGTLAVRTGDPQMRPANLFRLQPGQRAVFAPGRQTAPVPVWSDKASAQWVAGMLVFKSTPLSEVLAQTNRYSPRQIVLGDPSLGVRRVTGTFRPLPVDALAVSLATAFSLRVRAEPNEDFILLSK